MYVRVTMNHTGGLQKHIYTYILYIQRDKSREPQLKKCIIFFIGLRDTWAWRPTFNYIHHVRRVTIECNIYIYNLSNGPVVCYISSELYDFWFNLFCPVIGLTLIDDDAYYIILNVLLKCIIRLRIPNKKVLSSKYFNNIRILYFIYTYFCAHNWANIVLWAF